MNSKRRRNCGKRGNLPEMAPLANPYIPFQLEDAPKYDPRMALIRGTLYPGLDLPFMGMVNTKQKAASPIHDLQTLAFVLQELALYLDTHREDQQALDMYRAYQEMYHKSMMDYSKTCKPLNHSDPSRGTYQWLSDPWPWEYCANKEA